MFDLSPRRRRGVSLLDPVKRPGALPRRDLLSPTPFVAWPEPARRRPAQRRTPDINPGPAKMPFPWWRSALLGQVDDYTYSANGRTAKYLKTVSKNGDLPFFIADSIKTDGRKAVDEFGDLLKQVEADDPRRAYTLEREVRGRLAGAAEAHFQRFAADAPKSPEAPVAGGSTPAGGAKPPRSGLARAEAAARGVLGPAYGQVKALAKGFETLLPGADVKDMKTGSAEVTEGIRSEDKAKVAEGAAKMLGGIAGMALPGSYSGAKKAIGEAVEGVRKVARDAPDLRRQFGSDADHAAYEARRQSGVPLGFKDAADARAFGDDIHASLGKAGHGDAKVVVRGSAATGRKFNPDSGKYDGAPFNEGRRSDLDIGIADAKLHEKAKALGLKPRGHGGIGPLKPEAMKKLGLGSLPVRKNGKKSTYMIYPEVDTIIERGPFVGIVGRKGE